MKSQIDKLLLESERRKRLREKKILE